MSVSVKRVGLESLDLLMEWRMRVLAEVFPVGEQEVRSDIRKNNEAY